MSSQELVRELADAPLAPMDVSGRADRLSAAFHAARIDALLVTNLTNIRYLTGFTGSAALLLVGQGGMSFVTDGRYGEQAEQQLGAAGVKATIEVTGVGQREVLQAATANAKVSRLGLEADNVSWAAADRYATNWFPALELAATSGLVEKLRMVKDPGEIARITSACAIADAALAEVRPMLAEGPTEGDFALNLDATMRRLGAQDVSFETIVASGPNGALPHHRPATRPIAPGDLVVIDFGALVDGYHSDMTRTVMIGEPTATQARMYQVVLEAQAAGVAAVRAGVEAKAVDAACRKVIEDAGWGEAFLHGTGHGLGLDIHEDPRVGQSSTATLVDRCVVTVEPGVYLPGHGGVRIEDTVVVTAQGAQTITRTHKDAAV